MKWYDINGKNGVSTYNLNYELGSVMFCLGALHSQAAYGYISKSNSLENVQQCINEYKEAASCFAYIRQHISQSFSTVQVSWDMTDNALLGFENYTHGMEQLAVMKKAELSGTKPYAMAVIMFGCKKMFLDAASAFNNCGSSGFNLAQRCNILASLSEIRGYLCLVENYEANIEVDQNCGLAMGMVSECKRLIGDVNNKYGRSLTPELRQEIDSLQ